MHSQTGFVPYYGIWMENFVRSLVGWFVGSITHAICNAKIFKCTNAFARLALTCRVRDTYWSGGNAKIQEAMFPAFDFIRWLLLLGLLNILSLKWREKKIKQTVLDCIDWCQSVNAFDIVLFIEMSTKFKFYVSAWLYHIIFFFCLLLLYFRCT